MSKWECDPDRQHIRNAKMIASATCIQGDVNSVCARVSLKDCEYNEAGTNNWIPVKNGNSHNIRRKNTQQLTQSNYTIQ